MTTDAIAKPDNRPESEPKTGRRHKALWWTAGVFLTLALATAILAAIWDWNWFRGPVASIASARMHRQVTITGDLRVHPFSWQPSATVDGVTVANPAWAPKDQQLARINRIAVKIRLIPLFTGNWDLRLLRFDHPVATFYRDAQGRATWDLSDGKNKDKPLRLPPIRNFIISDGQLSYFDAKRNLSFKGTIDAREKLGADNRGFQMVGQGALNKQPFTLKVTGGPLLNIDKDKPYPFDGEVRAADTFITAQGAVPKPFDLGRFYMNTTARGPDLGDLYSLIGVPLPNTPPYSLHGRLSRDEHLWRIDGLGGRVGSSDLAGVISVKTGGQRPILTANLRSDSLSFPDLTALFGGGAARGAVASPAQLATGQVMRAQQKMFPDSTLNTDKIRAIDADVTYKAVSIRDAPIHLRASSTRVALKAGLLKANPLVLELPQGRIEGWLNMDARKAMPSTDLDLRLSNARLESLIPVKFQGKTPFSGGLVGRARLHGTGNSVHRALAKADGELTIVAPGGQINEALAELIGVDLTKGLGLLNAKKQTTTEIRCGVADFKAKNGLLTANSIVLDTGPVLVTGSGIINLDSETLAFQVQGHPKEFRLVRLLLPITLEGPILHPKQGFKKGGVVAQGGIALALAAVSPLAVILPFVDPGLAKDANCAALMAQGRAQGAPVKTAPTH